MSVHLDEKAERKLAAARQEFDSIGYGYSLDYALNQFMKHVGKGLALLTEAVEAMEERRRLEDGR